MRNVFYFLLLEYFCGWYKEGRMAQVDWVVSFSPLRPNHLYNKCPHPPFDLSTLNLVPSVERKKQAKSGLLSMGHLVSSEGQIRWVGTWILLPGSVGEGFNLKQMNKQNEMWTTWKDNFAQISYFCEETWSRITFLFHFSSPWLFPLRIGDTCMTESARDICWAGHIPGFWQERCPGKQSPPLPCS